MVDLALKDLSPKFDAMYSHAGRPSIPPEKLLKASLLQAFFTARSERQLGQQIGYNILLRWILGTAQDAQTWDATVFTKKPRFGGGNLSSLFRRRAGAAPQEAVALLRTLHRGRHPDRSMGLNQELSPKDSQDGPPQGPVGRNEAADFRGQKLSSITHASVTDPDAKLSPKSKQHGRTSTTWGMC